MSEDELELDTLEIEKRHSLLSLIQMIPLTLWCLSCTHSYLTYFVIKQMMDIEEDYLFM